MDIIAICISLASLLVAMWAVRVSKSIAKQQHEDAVNAEQRQVERENLAKQEQKRKERKRLQDRKDARKEANASPLARLAGVTEELEEDIYLDKQLGRR